MQLVLVSPEKIPGKTNVHSILSTQIKKALPSRGIHCENVKVDRGYLLAKTDNEVEAAAIIAEFPGVEFSSVIDQVASDYDDLLNGILNVGRKVIFPKQSFKVSVDVEDPIGYMASDIETVASAKLVAELASLGCKIDEISPLKTIHAKARKDSAYVFDLRYEGSGGIPIGVSGTALCPEIGVESTTLANWLVIRMGFEPRFVMFNLEPYSPHRQLISAAKSIISILRKTPLNKVSMDVISAGSEIQRMASANPNEAPIIARLLLGLINGQLAKKLKCDVLSWPAGINENPLWLMDVSKEFFNKLGVRLLSSAAFLTLNEIRRDSLLMGLSDESHDVQWLNNLNRFYDHDEIRNLNSRLDLFEISKKLLNENLRNIVVTQKSTIHSILDNIV